MRSVLPLFLLACGGSASQEAADTDDSSVTPSAGGTVAPGTCAFTACGGDLVGTWSFVAGCTLDEEDTCQTVHYDLTPSGTLTFDADNTYAVAVDVSSDTSFTFPSGCLAVSCSDVGQEYGVPCSDQPDGDCVCSLTEPYLAYHETGTWNIQGNGVLLDEDTDQLMDTLYREFCVQGNELTIKAIDPTEGSLVLTATRQ